MSTISKTGLDFLTTDLSHFRKAHDRLDFTYEDYVDGCFDAIDKNNHQGLRLNAVLPPTDRGQHRESVRQRARELQEEFHRNGNKAPSLLHGTLCVVKDSYAVRLSQLGFGTTGGTNALLPGNHSENAEVVDRMLAAGAIVVASCNMDKFNGMNNEDGTAGWSPRGGQTVSAFTGNRDFSCGSSVGPAVALSAGWALIALGGETNGSVTLPANEAGLYSLKPTKYRQDPSEPLVSKQGEMPIKGILPLAPWTFDTIGPMGRSTFDVAASLDCMLGADGRHVAALVASNHDLSKFRVGVPRKDLDYTHYADPNIQTEAKDVFDRYIGELTGKVGGLVENADAPGVMEFIYDESTHPMTYKDGKPQNNRQQSIILAHEFFKAMPDYLASTETSLRTLSDIAEWNKQHPTQAFYGGKYTEKSQARIELALTSKGDTDSEAYKKARATVLKHGTELEKYMETQGLDVLIVPPTFAGSTLPALSGGPLGSVPYTTLSNGEPYGALVVGRCGQEDSVLQFMSAHECAFGSSRPISSRLRDSQQ